MCIAAWVWQTHPLYPLLLVFNRDEIYNRPTEPLSWWGKGKGKSKILSGRDEVTGGTWLACSKNGRIAFLTNVREDISIESPKFRGHLPIEFLECNTNPFEFAKNLENNAQEYKGFNLVIADLHLKIMLCISNRTPELFQIVSPGIHVLSNASIDSPWPKSVRLAQGFQQLLENNGAKEILPEELVYQLMRDTVKADRSQLPDTCYGSDAEYEISSIFVDARLDVGYYRTISTSVVSIKRDMIVSFYEENLEDEYWNKRFIEYQIED